VGGRPNSLVCLLLTAPAILFVASRLAHDGRSGATPDVGYGGVRFLQKGLLVVGSTALGASIVGLGVIFCIATLSVPHGGHNDLSGVGLAFIFLGGGAVLGAIAGCIAGVWWIRKHEGEVWTRRVWIAVSLGIALGFALPFTKILGELTGYWPVTAVLCAALGMLGGVFATIAGSPWNRDDGGQRGNRKQSP
jgi:hypothetical protein